MGFKSQIADSLVSRINLVTVLNGYTKDIKTIRFDRVKLNIAEYEDWELPAVQLIDLSKLFRHEMSRSASQWFIAVELCLRTTEELGVVDQRTLWDLMEDIIRAIMAEPKLGLPFVQHCRLVDEITDLHLQEPNYTATIGLEVLYHEPITRDNC